MCVLKTTHPVLFDNTLEKDVVYTPLWLSKKIVEHFSPAGKCLDPCRGDGAFYQFLPAGADWCEIAEGRDFLAYDEPMDWVIGNPPYSGLIGWFRHSFRIADNVVFLVPLHRLFNSYTFIKDVRNYGGLKELLIIGTGATAGFPFGHTLGAAHYKKNYIGETKWSFI